MASKQWMRNTRTNAYFQVSRSTQYPQSSDKQDSKKFAEFNSCGRMTLGKVKK
jgi:hypothetical protein